MTNHGKIIIIIFKIRKFHLMCLNLKINHKEFESIIFKLKVYELILFLFRFIVMIKIQHKNKCILSALS